MAVPMGVEYFNVAAITVLALFAVYGAVVLFYEKAAPVKAGRVLPVFCAAALTAFALEATVFNMLHYLKYINVLDIGGGGGGGQIGGVLEPSETEPGVVLAADGTRAELIDGGIRFNNINMRATSVFVNMKFENVETAEMFVKWTDEANTQQYVKRLYKYLPHENYAPLQSCGKVYELSIMFNAYSDGVQVEEVVINKPIPFYFSGLRLLAVSLSLFALFALINKNLRAKAAYYLFVYKFDPKNEKQNAVYVCTVALLVLFSWVCVYTSVTGDFETFPANRQYNKFLVDALIAGRAYLDDAAQIPPPEILLNAQRPYDTRWLSENGYRRQVDWYWDWAWYKGKYYCYFGVVPAAVLFAPYKIITGEYLSNYAGVFLFCAFAVILLALLWRHCVEKYMRDTGYALYLLSFLTLFFASGMSAILRKPSFYTIAQSGGFMFAAAGVLLLLKSVGDEKINHIKLFFGCLCLALVFGCRPNMGVASLLVPVVLWRRRSWKVLPFVSLPYILVALPLCMYNYVRFESIFDFGANYNLTVANLTEYGSQNPIGKLVRAFVPLCAYLFYPNALSPHFPFVEGCRWPGYTSGVYMFVEKGGGIINFPIVFCLLYMFKKHFGKNKPEIFYALCASLIIAALIIVVISTVGFTGRYMLDIASFIILPSLFCAYYWNTDDKSLLPPQVRVKITCALCAASILTGLFLFVNGTDYLHHDPTLYRYLECSLQLFH